MNIEKIEQHGSKWVHPTTGEVRYYINEWANLAGLSVGRYGTGNISSASLDGEKISNTSASQTIGQVDKVWVAGDKVHVKGRESRKAAIGLQAIADRIKKALSE